MFVLHYFENCLTTANLHNWPIISHASLRHLSSRQAFTVAVARPWGEIPGSEVAGVVRFLVSRFLRPPSIAIGEREIGLLAKALLASKVPYQHMFLLGTKEYAISEEGVHIWEFPVHHFPSPPWSPNQWYLWGHGTTPQGLVGILTAGRVFPSNAGGRHYSFRRGLLQFLWQSHAMEQLDSTSHEFLSKIHNSTRRTVLGSGFNHQKSKRAEATRESHLCKYHCLVHSPSSDKRWAIREAGARIDRILVLSSADWAGNPSMPSSPTSTTFAGCHE